MPRSTSDERASASKSARAELSATAGARSAEVIVGNVRARATKSEACTTTGRRRRRCTSTNGRPSTRSRRDRDSPRLIGLRKIYIHTETHVSGNSRPWRASRFSAIPFDLTRKLTTADRIVVGRRDPPRCASDGSCRARAASKVHGVRSVSRSAIV